MALAFSRMPRALTLVRRAHPGREALDLQRLTVVLSGTSAGAIKE